MRFVEAGYFSSHVPVRIGRGVSCPPQLGQLLRLQLSQNVHSREQISAPPLSAGKSRPQFSQLGRISSTSYPQWRNYQSSEPLCRLCRYAGNGRRSKAARDDQYARLVKWSGC